MRVALKEVDRARVVLDVGAQGRVWKFFLLLPRVLLYRPPGGGLVPKSRLQERFSIFASDTALDRQSVLCNPSRNCSTSQTPQRQGEMILKQRQALVQLGELSVVHHVLEGSSGPTQATLDALQNPEKRPPEPREPLPDDMWERRGPAFCLDRDVFAKNLRCSRRGAAGGPSGMTSEHLHPLLDNPEDTKVLEDGSGFGPC